MSNTVKFAAARWLVCLIAAAFSNGFAATESGSEPLEEIVVRGVRSSLAKSLEIKRNSVGLVDAIVAEDIGKFPDLNLSESLQRMTGVTINRLEGEGQQVTVRGLAPQFTRVTINGTSVMSGNAGRDVDFDIFASELFSSVSLYKTPSADMAEGGLAATINLTTPRPFDVEDFSAVTSIHGTYNDLGEKWDPRATVVISNVIDGGKFGYLMGAAYSDRLLRGDKAEGFRYTSANFDLDNDGTDDFTGVDLALLPRQQFEVRDRERLNLVSALQFKPNEEFSIDLDFLYVDFKEVRERYNFTGVTFFAPVVASDLTVDNGLIVDGTFVSAGRSLNPPNVPIWSENLKADITDELFSGSLNASWTIGRDWDAAMFLGYASAQGTNDELRVVFQADDQFSYRMSGRGYPIISTPLDPLDNDRFFHNQTRHLPSVNQNDETSQEVHFRRNLDVVGMPLFSFGLRASQRENSRDSFDGTVVDNSISMSSQITRGLPVSNAFEDFPGLVVTDFVTVNFANLEADPRVAQSSVTATQNLLDSYTISEDAVGAYAMADFEGSLGGMNVAANLGVRYVETDVKSAGYLRDADTNTFSPFSLSKTYSDTLPSLNVRMEASDSLILRFGASKAITRPPLADLAPRRTQALAALAISAGNPELDPFRVSQTDVGAEWYFADNSLLSLVYFFKDVKSFVVRSTSSEVINGQTFLVTKPLNGTGGEVSGFEFTYQQPFTFLPNLFNGLGVLANFTSADSEITTIVGGNVIETKLPGQSDSSYNIIAYYDKGPLNIRAAYSWRDSYVLQVRNDGRVQYLDDYGQLDISARYDVTDDLALVLDAINLGREHFYSYDTDIRHPLQNHDTGRVYSIGIRYNFD